MMLRDLESQVERYPVPEGEAYTYIPLIRDDYKAHVDVITSALKTLKVKTVFTMRLLLFDKYIPTVRLTSKLD